MFHPLLRRFAPVLVALILASGAQAQEAQRWALVVGNAEYQNAGVDSLANTVNDARTMAASLTNMGFKVYLRENANRADVEDALARIRADHSGADLGLFFFAGHGLQLGGTNYALPSDIDPSVPDFLETQGISITRLIADLSATGVDKLVVILDSCRNSPFGDDQAYGTGLALVDAPANTIIAYSTAPGAVALDGSGVNSPFTSALAAALDGPRQDLRDVLKLVRARVRLATGGAQTPWYIDNSSAEMIIQPREEIVLGDQFAGALGDAPSLLATTWRTISTSSDPNDFDLFLRLYPQHQLASVAREQVAQLRGSGQVDLPRMELGVPDPNPAVPGGLGAIITECDLLATRGGDVMALVEPVPHDLVNTRAALRACIAAVGDDPDNPRLIGNLARVLVLEERYDEARFYFELASELGNPTGFGGLAELYRYGLGVEPDLARAAEYTRQGALMGSATLRVGLAVFYRNGWGVPQSYSEALSWLQLAAMAGDTVGLQALGDMYARGEGTEQDPARALTFYKRAADAGSTDAMNAIGMAYMRGEGVEVDLNQGIQWLTRASERGNPYSAFHLGRAFQRGWGVTKDARTALAYFRLSAQRNFLTAYAHIAEMLKGGDGIEPDLPQAYANYTIAIEAAKLRDTQSTRKRLEEFQAGFDALLPTMTADQIAEGSAIAQRWIEQYGLVDFVRVNE